MELRYQTIPSDEAVKLAKIKSERIPLLIDYSDKYTDNQPRQIDEVTYSEGFGLNYDIPTDVISIGAGSFSIDNDEIVITSKITREGTPLYYQYQPKFDMIHP